MRRIPAYALFVFIAFAMFPWNTLAAEAVNQGVLKKILIDKKWEMKWAACMGAPPCRAYWDWKADGSVCARVIDAKMDERCADDGRWRLKGNSLCWELTWYGTGGGFKKACVKVEPSGPGNYTAIRVGGFGTPFFRFTVAQDL